MRCVCGADFSSGTSLFKLGGEEMLMCEECLRVYAVSEQSFREMSPRDLYNLRGQHFFIVMLARVERAG